MRPNYFVTFRSILALALLATSLLVSTHGQDALKTSERVFNFGTVLEDAPLTHDFEIENLSTEPLEIANVLVTSPLFFKNVRKQIPPGEKRRITISMGTPRPPGDYEGQLEVAFKDPRMTNLIFEVRGKIVPLIEVAPYPAFFVATQKGEAKQAMLEIINHDTTPLDIYRVEQPGTRFSTQLKTVEPGSRYSLTLSLDGKGAPGRQTELIKLFTSNKKTPVVLVQANTYIKERVYTFPETMDWGRVDPGEFKTQAAPTQSLSQILMVYQNGGTNFQVTAKATVPFVKVAAEPSRFKDRYELTATLIPERLPVAGYLEGQIVISTNDKDFPTLEIPITALLESD